ncbi:hypothetical protein QOT17_009626 [Balamuthia mandrillaris]
MITGCLSTGAIMANITLNNVWVQGPCVPVPLLHVDGHSTLSLDNVHLQNEDGAVIVMEAGSSLVTNDIFIGTSANAVKLNGVTWVSNGAVNVEDSVSSDSYAVGVSQNSLWMSNGPVHFRNCKPYAVLLDDGSAWASSNEVSFENCSNAVTLNRSSTWEQNGLVKFLHNEAAVELFLGENCIARKAIVGFDVQSSTWRSKSLIEFYDNTISSGAYIRLQNSNASFLYTPSLPQTPNPPGLLACFSSTVYAPPTDCSASSCINCNFIPIPLVEWQRNPQHMMVSDKKGTKKVVFYEAGEQPFFLHFNPLPTNTFLLDVMTESLDRDDGSIFVKNQSILVEPNSPKAPEFVVAITDASPTTEFQLVLRPSSEYNPTYSLTSNNYAVNVAVTPPVRLPTAAILFPEGSPDFIFAPTGGKQAEDISATALRAFFLQLVEVDSSAQTVVTSVSLVDMLWESVVDSSSGEIIFSANFTVEEEEEEEEEERPVVMQVVFQAVAGGEEVELPNGSLLAFQEDGLKWTLLLQDWPFVHEDNLLELHTILRTGEEQWLNVQEVHSGGGGGGEGEKEEREFVLEAEESRALLRVLSVAWAEEEFETSKQVGVRVERLEEAEAEAEVVFTLPHFHHSLRYDPDVSVLLTGSDGGDGEDGEEEEDEDEMLLAIVLPVVLGVVVLVAVVVTATTVVVRKRMNGRTIKQGAAVNFE